MMLTIEEDPDVSASIKESLSSGFVVRHGDVFTLEIMSTQALTGVITLEVWKFSLTSQGESDGSQISVVQDPRSSRLFEKLGTLLKSVICYCRLLPAHRLSRKQKDYPDLKFGYAVCKHEENSATLAAQLARLGKDAKYNRIATLHSGLVLNNGSQSPLALQVSVHYRLKLVSLSLDATVQVSWSRESGEVKPQVSARRRPRPGYLDWRGEKYQYSCNQNLQTSPTKWAMEEEIRRMKLMEFAKEPCEYDPQRPRRVKPAFAEDDDEFMEDMHCGALLNREGTYSELDMNKISEHEASDDDTDVNSDECTSDDDSNSVNEATLPSKESKNRPEDSKPSTIQLPFSNDGGPTRSRLNYLFCQLREKADLDLFKPQPQTTTTNRDHTPILDELEDHEKTLKEFDDFLENFSHLEVFPHEFIQAPMLQHVPTQPQAQTNPQPSHQMFSAREL
ncbi:hypothetical protein Ciccas_007120 [Cichlidogyrus casuarinus]|uniref:Uncharacterized protein n=1 Tax=Cichlidogyrus casuarinus TaxID=1844966 RepID=A0ABD2Q6C1_9PLAT